MVRNADDLMKFRSLREEGTYEVALNRLYNLRSRWISGRTLVSNPDMFMINGQRN